MTLDEKDCVIKELFIPDATGTGLIAGRNVCMPPPNTIQINKCEKIILNQHGIDVKFELNNDNIKKFKQFIINEVKFLRAESFCEDLLNELRKSNKEDLKWYDVEQVIHDVLEGYSK